MKNLNIFVFFFFLTVILMLMSGCSTINTREQQEVLMDKTSKKQYVFPSEEELLTCIELPLLKSKSTKELFEVATISAELYNDCSISKDVLSSWIKRHKKDISN